MKMELNTNLKTVKKENISTKEKMNITPEIKQAVEVKPDKVEKTKKSTELATSSDGDKLEEDENRRVINEISKKLEPLNHSLKYAVHDKTNQLMVKVVDEKTEEVIVEIPAEESLDRLATLLEEAGILK